MTLASLNKLLDLMAGDQRLIEVLQSCRKVRGLTLLDHCVETIGDADVVAVARKVQRLLKANEGDC